MLCSLLKSAAQRLSPTLQIRSGQGRDALIDNLCSRLLHLDVMRATAAEATRLDTS